jgi:hypothetical protein
MFQPSQRVVYNNEEYNVIGHQGDNWVRISKKHESTTSGPIIGFCVHKVLLTLVEVNAQPESLKKLSSSVEKARMLVQHAVDYKSLYFHLRQTGYLQNDLRAFIAEQNRREQHFGLLKSMVIAKLSKIIRTKEMH